MGYLLQSFGEVYETTIVRGAGCYVYDDRGQRFVDFEAGVWSTALGHSHPKINAVLQEQMNRIMHLGYRYKNSVVEDAAQVVLDRVGIPDGKCIFLCSGSEAVEFGIQVAGRLIPRPLLLSLSGSYLGAFGLAAKPSSSEWHKFDWSSCSLCARECSVNCSLIQSIPFNKIAAFVFEPGSASGLVKAPPMHLVKFLSEKIQAEGGLLIANEVTTGLGRTGEWFGYLHYGLQPDIVALGKHLGNGYPVSSVALRGHLAKELEASSFRYAQSHQNDALGCAVASEVLRILDDEKLVERSKSLGNGFVKKLEALQAVCPDIVAVRGRGLMIAIELNHPNITELHRELFVRGYIVGINPIAKVLRFYPPLVIGEHDIDELVRELGLLLK